MSSIEGRSKRGRPKNLGRRREIALAAATLFARKGYGAATMAEIADAAGMSESLLYHYFRHKHEIPEALMDRYVDLLARLGQRGIAAVRGAHSCESFLLGFGKAYVEYLQQSHDLLLFWLMDVEPFAERIRHVLELVGGIYQTFGKRLGTMPDYRNGAVDPVTAVRLFSGSLFTPVVFHLRFEMALPAKSYDALVEQAARFAARACKA